MAHVVVFDGGKQDMSTFIGSIVSKIIDRHPSKTPRLLFPTGSTPLGPDGYFAALINLRKNHSVKTEGIRLVSGDEYHGIKPSNPGSFCTYLTNNVMTPLGMSIEQSLQLNGGFIGDEKKADEECLNFENNLRLDPCELAVLGLGTNGHVAFNDPPSDVDTTTRRLNLTQGSIDASQHDFPNLSKNELPTEALSVGLKTLKECAKMCVVLVVGEKKKDIVKKCLSSNQPITPDVPASQLRDANNFMFFMDHDAAKELLAPENKQFAPAKVTIIPNFSNSSGNIFHPPEEFIPKANKSIQNNRKAIVVADIGGTNGRIRVFLKSIHDSDENENIIKSIDKSPWFEKVYRMSLFHSYSEVAKQCVDDISTICKRAGVDEKNNSHIEFISGCWAVCGPVTNNGAINDPNNLW